MGTPQELTDELGEVVWCNYEYAWGGSYQDYYKEQSLNNCAILEHELQPIKFQGQSLDIETGLHYNRFRYYDSDVGMFIQRDPIGLLGGFNIFQYAPNPIHWVDPWGLAKKKKTKNPVLSEQEQSTKPTIIQLNPQDINFAQISVNKKFDTPSGKQPIQSVINSGSEQVKNFPPISIIKVKNQWVARDGNSRLLIARETKSEIINAVDESSDLEKRKNLSSRLKQNGLPSTGTCTLPTPR